MSDKPRVGWLHGYTMDSTTWQELWSLLPGMDHVGVDLPEHGHHADVPMPGSLPEVASWVADKLRAEGCTQVVSLSFGSAVGLQVALDHPDVARKLVLAAPTLSGMPDDKAAWAKYRLLMQELWAHGSAANVAQIWMADPPPIFAGLRRFPQAYAAMEEVVGRHRFTELRTGSMRHLADTVHTAETVSQISSDVLVMVGTNDMPRFVENARILQENVRSCRTVTIPDAGHLPILEEPALAARELAAFLDPAESGQPQTGLEALPSTPAPLEA